MRDTRSRLGQAARDVATSRRERLARLDRRLDELIFVAALLSIPVALHRGELTVALVAMDLTAWGIFLLEAVVKVAAHGRRDYVADPWNRADLAIIVLSAPYHLLGGGAVVARLGSTARLLRLVRATLVVAKALRGGRALLSRRNVPAAGAVVAVATVAAASVVLAAEGGEGRTFAHFGDALWWALVTLTTVGYGDLSPTTGVGRGAAIVLMVVGVALLGTVAASLASRFVDDDAAEDAAEVLAQLQALRADLAGLRQEIAALRDPPTGSDPAPPGIPPPPRPE